MPTASRVKPSMSKRRYKKYPTLTKEQQALVIEHKWISGRLAYGAKCLTGGYTGSLTREDLESIANFALCVAATRYNPGMNVKYSTYAWNTASGYIQHALRDHSRMVRTPRWVATYRNLVDELAKEGKSYEEIAEILEVDTLKVVECQLAANNYHVSYDSSPEDWVTPEFVFSVEEHEAALCSVDLINLIRDLNDQEMVLMMKYLDNQPLTEEDREWAADKFYELHNMAHGFTQEI